MRAPCYHVNNCRFTWLAGTSEIAAFHSVVSSSPAHLSSEGTDEHCGDQPPWTWPVCKKQLIFKEFWENVEAKFACKPWYKLQEQIKEKVKVLSRVIWLLKEDRSINVNNSKDKDDEIPLCTGIFLHESTSADWSALQKKNTHYFWYFWRLQNIDFQRRDHISTYVYDVLSGNPHSCCTDLTWELPSMWRCALNLP